MPHIIPRAFRIGLVEIDLPFAFQITTSLCTVHLDWRLKTKQKIM
jgi:hypothetical protein